MDPNIKEIGTLFCAIGKFCTANSICKDDPVKLAYLLIDLVGRGLPNPQEICEALTYFTDGGGNKVLKKSRYQKLAQPDALLALLALSIHLNKEIPPWIKKNNRLCFLSTTSITLQLEEFDPESMSTCTTTGINIDRVQKSLEKVLPCNLEVAYWQAVISFWRNCYYKNKMVCGKLSDKEKKLVIQKIVNEKNTLLETVNTALQEAQNKVDKYSKDLFMVTVTEAFSLEPLSRALLNDSAHVSGGTTTSTTKNTEKEYSTDDEEEKEENDAFLTQQSSSSEGEETQNHKRGSSSPLVDRRKKSNTTVSP